MPQIKTQEEIKYVEIACSVTDEIFNEAISFVKKHKNITEIELKNFILLKIKQRGLRPSFSPIVTSNKNAGNEIHPEAKSTKLKGFTIIDLGVRYKGYCSDMTRTIYVGLPSKKDIDLYNLVLASQLLGIKLSCVSTHTCTIDTEVRESLGKYKKYFIHTLGHGVGRKIHEPPIIYQKRTKPVLKNNMIITIEPGIYIPNKLGIRIEDTVCISEKKPVILTKTPKKLIYID